MMTNRLWIGLVICGALVLSIGTIPSSADDCKANLLGYSWQCKAENVNNHQSMDFVLSFNNLYNQSIAEISIPDMGLQASGPFACDMHRKFFTRQFVSGRSFFASLFSWVTTTSPQRTLTLTGDSYRHWIVNGNGQIANALNVSVVVPVNIPVNISTYVPAYVLTNTSAFVYRCGSPTPIEPF